MRSKNQPDFCNVLPEKEKTPNNIPKKSFRYIFWVLEVVPIETAVNSVVRPPVTAVTDIFYTIL